MIYYTGDIHGDVLHIRDMVTKYEVTDQDVIVILGDVNGDGRINTLDIIALRLMLILGGG